MSRFENRRWLIIDTSLTSSIDFDQIIQNSVDQLRLSEDGTQTFVKYDITEITSSYTESYFNEETNQSQSREVIAGVYGRPTLYDQGQEYTHEEILEVLAQPAWTGEPIELNEEIP